MKLLTFYGASDDLLEVTGPGGDEFTADHNDSGVFRLARPDGQGIRVRLTLTQDGTWEVGVAALMDDPDDPAQGIPRHWRLSLFQGAGPVPIYSMGLTVECDDDALLAREDES